MLLWDSGDGGDSYMRKHFPIAFLMLFQLGIIFPEKEIIINYLEWLYFSWVLKIFLSSLFHQQ